MNISDLNRNQFMLKGNLAKKGYDWWWHSLTAKNKATGVEKAFFIEYFITNPEISKNKVVFGQGIRRPSYVMMKVGTWGETKAQIHNFYPISNLYLNPDKLQLDFGDCHLSETHIKGSCQVTEVEAAKHPEWFSDSGKMSWDLKVNKCIAYHVGYGASKLLRKMNAFEMFWHAEGIKTEYSGTINWNNEEYIAEPHSSFGYADKNWGKNYTSPWLWISSCHLISELTGRKLNHSAIEVGGGQPKIFGLPLKRKLLMGVHYEGQNFDFNFSKFWKKSHIEFEFIEQSPNNYWRIKAQNKKYFITLALECPQSEMLKIRYESPDGQMRHQKLWNGGTATGTMTIYQIKNKEKLLLDRLKIKNAGCEYGEY